MDATEKTQESNDDSLKAMAEFTANKLGLSYYVLIGATPVPGTEGKKMKVSFAVNGTEAELATLIRTILKMAPWGVKRAIVKGEMAQQFADIMDSLDHEQ